MSLTKDTFCSFCGVAYPKDAPHPKTCEGCKVTVWSNPVPVALVLQPISVEGRSGLLVIRRGIEPKKGTLAVVGGFLEDHEDVEHGGAREMREETGVEIDPSTLRPFWFVSTRPKPNRVLLFLRGEPRDAATLGPAVLDHETLERGVVFGPDGIETLFGFDLHVEAVKRFFAETGIEGPADYRTI